MMLALASVLLLASQAWAAKSNPPCPEGLKCQSKYRLQSGQRKGYDGDPFACILPKVPFPEYDLENPLSVIFLDLYSEAFQLNGVETPILKRTVGYLDFAHFNALTAFHPTAMPFYYAKGFGLPFAKRITGAANTTRARNTAMAYAFYQAAKSLLRDPVPLAQTLTRLGLDPNYTGRTNLDDPRDIGNAAGFAMAEFFKNDGWNQHGDKDGSGMPYSDYTGYLPVNGPNRMNDITRWQPIMETDHLGYFFPQNHITAQLRSGEILPFSLPKDEFYGKYCPDDSKFNKPYPPQDKMTKADLDNYKTQADEVIDELASIDDKWKMLAELYDTKTVGFGIVPVWYYLNRFNWTQFQVASYYAAAHGALFDAIITSWKLKIQADAVRPINAIRYLYPDQNITTYSTMHKGVASYPGRFFNSYLRTMPHTDYPSATACICQTFAEVTEDFLGMKDNMPYEVTFTKGCSMVEPGATPAEDITVSYTKTADFVKDCAQTRMKAGVHFQSSVDSGVEACTGLGHDAYKKFQALLAGTAQMP